MKPFLCSAHVVEEKKRETHRFVIELTWNRRVALTLALAVALPLLAITGLLTALAAHPTLVSDANVGGGPLPDRAFPATVAISGPTTLAYQGRLFLAHVNQGNNIWNGAGQIKFAIISADHQTAYWTNDGTGMGQQPFQPASSVPVTVNVATGVFNVLLGDTTLTHMTQPITSGVFVQSIGFQVGRVLRVWFDNGTHGLQLLVPDVPLTAVPYALYAQTLNGLDASAFAPIAHTHSGADITSGTLADARLSPNVVLAGQGVSRLSNDAGYLTQGGANLHPGPNPQQIALLKWYTALSTTQSSYAVGSGPTLIAFDGANMWMANNFSGTVSVLRVSDGFHVMTPTVGAGPYGIAFDGSNMWVTNFNANTVSVLRASDGFHVMTLTVGANPQGLAFDGTNMWVTNLYSNTVSVLRASDGVQVMTPTVGTGPNGIAFDGANMWVTNRYDNSVSVLRVTDGFHVTTPTVGALPQGLAFDGTNMWVANNNATTVSVLRASDGAHVMTPTVGSFAQGVAFDGANMWVANAGGATISVLRASGGSLVKTVLVGSGAFGIAFDGAFMWVTNQYDNSVSKR